jgi:hypothetical protein
MSGGKSSRRGTPQGGVISPLLANVYMNRFLKHWRITGRGEAFRAHVAYAASRSKKSVKRIKAKVGELLVPGNKGPWLQVRNQLNSLLSGWSAYFSHGTRASAYRAIDAHVYDRVRHFLRKRHKVRGRGTWRFSYAMVYG